MISDSASGKSKGERLDSASEAMKNRMNPAKPHGVNTNQCAMPKVYRFCAATMSASLSEPTIMITVTADRMSGTS